MWAKHSVRSKINIFNFFFPRSHKTCVCVLIWVAGDREQLHRCAAWASFICYLFIYLISKVHQRSQCKRLQWLTVCFWFSLLFNTDTRVSCRTRVRRALLFVCCMQVFLRGFFMSACLWFAVAHTATHRSCLRHMFSAVIVVFLFACALDSRARKTTGAPFCLWGGESFVWSVRLAVC